MRKNVFALLLVLITALSLFSCDEGSGGVEDTSGYVFAPGVEPVIIFSNGISRDMFPIFLDFLFAALLF